MTYGVVSPRRSRWPPTDLNRSPWFPMQTRPRRTQCGVGADDSFVTSARGCEGPDSTEPLPSAGNGAHLAFAVRAAFFAYFLCGGKESKCLPRTGANANRPLTNQGKANTASAQKKSATQANRSRKGQRSRHTEKKRHTGKQIKKSPTPQAPRQTTAAKANKPGTPPNAAAKGKKPQLI
jgi:hypothetical protein